jgi:purine nucleosidase
MKTPKKHILIDTDPGIDDALAILLAVVSPELVVEGLTIVPGNSTLANNVRNALAILELAGRSDIPVAGGMPVPLVKSLLIAPETHSDSGLGYAVLPEPRQPALQTHGVQFLIERILAKPGELSLVCLGPLTNLAMALRLEPRIIPALKQVIIMGGAINHGGNTTPSAEFNIYCDPHAAHIVFHAGLPITLAPLDVTYQALLTTADVERLLKTNSPIARFVADATRYYMEFHEAHQHIQGCMINDPLALALAFAPELVETQRLYVDVDISGGVSMGKTFADFYEIWKAPANMDVALRVRARDFIELFLGRMEKLCRDVK